MYGDQKSSIQAAADAAQKVNAMLIAKGKLKPSQLTQNTPKPRQGVQSTNTIFAEVCINDVPSQVRNMLTRGSTQEEISKNSSAAVATRGRFMTEEDKSKFPNEKPLYLSVQGPDQYSVDAAVRRIHQMIESHLTRQDVYKENRFLRQMEGFGIPSSRLTDTAPISVAPGLMLSSRLDTNPMLSSRLESPLLSTRLDTGSILSSRMDTGSLLSKRLDSSSILSSRLDTSPMLSSRLDTSPMLSSRLDTSPMLSSRLDTSSMLSSRLDTSSLLSSRRDHTLSSRLDVGRLGPSRMSSSLSINTRPSVNSLLLEDKIYVGMEGAPESFALKDKILGPGGSYLGHIAIETGAKVMLRGKGSGHLETSAGLETPEPMHIYLQHERITGLQQSKDLANNLLQTIRDEYQSQMLAMVHVPGLSTVPIISGSGVVSVTNVLSSGGMAAPTLQQQTLLPPVSSGQGVLLVSQTDALQQQALLPGQPAILLPEGQLQVPNMPPPQIVQVAPPPHAVGVPPPVVHPTPMGAVQGPLGAPLGAPGGVLQGMPTAELTQEQKLLQLQLEALKQQQPPHAPPVSVAASMAPPTVQPGLAPPQILQATPTGQIQSEMKPQIPQIGPINVPPPIVVPASMQHQVIHPGLAAQQPGMAQALHLQGQPQPGMTQAQTVIAQHIQLQGQPQPGMPTQPIHQVQVMPPPVAGVPPPPNSMAPAPVPQPVAPALSHVTGAPTTSGAPTTGGVPVPQSKAPPTSQGLSYEQYRKVDKEKRRFTEEKDDEVKVPENLLGYQHGPPHLAKLTTPTPSTAAPTDSMATPTSSSSKREDNTTTATEQDKSSLKRTSSSGASDASTAKKAKDGATPTSSSETVETREDVRLSDSKLHKMVSRSSFNQYSGQPQLYQPPQSEQLYAQQTTDQYAPTSSAPHQFSSSVAPQYSAPPPGGQYAQAPQYGAPTSVGAPYSQPPPVQQVGAPYSQPPPIVQNPVYASQPGQPATFSQLPQVQAQYQQPPPVLQSVGAPYAQPAVQPPYSIATQQYSAPQAQYAPGQYADSIGQQYPVHSAPYSASYPSFSQASYAAFSQAGAQQAFPAASQANGGSRYGQDYQTQAGYAQRPRYEAPY